MNEDKQQAGIREELMQEHDEEPQVITCCGGAVLPPFSAQVPQEDSDGE